MASLFLTRLRRRIWRERRRLPLVAVLMFASGYLANMHLGMTIMGLDVAMVTGFAYALVFTPLALLLALVLPSWRFTVESVAVVFLFFGIAGAIDPAYSLSALWHGKTIWLVLLSFVAVSHLYTMPLLDRITIAAPRSRRAGWSRLPAQVLWDGLVGTPPHRDRLANAERIMEFGYLEPGKPHLRIVERVDKLTLLEEHQFVDEIDAPHAIRFRWHAVSADDDLWHAKGEKQLRITDMGGYRRIEITGAPRRIPLRLLVLNWIDDNLGRSLDDELNQLERRAAVPPTPHQRGQISAA